MKTGMLLHVTFQVPSCRPTIPILVLMHLDGILDKLMVEVAPTIYCKYVTTNAKGKSDLCVQLEKAVHGMMKSALLFYQKTVC
jgi:hypothetical protein